MKIIHTSDWHIGQNFYGYDRYEEHDAVLEKIIEICRDENPDALLVSGDVFDVAQPPAQAQRLFAQKMMRLRQDMPALRIIVTAGNHDSASRIEAVDALWSAVGIDVVGVLTQYESVLLNSYVAGGGSWGLDARDSGVFVLPPREKADANLDVYRGTADAISQNIDFVDNYEPEYMLILSGDHIYKMNYAKMLQAHKENGADATIAVIEVPMKEASRFGIMNTDPETGRIVEFEEKPAEPKSNLASMGIYIFNWKLLRRMLVADMKNEESSHDFGKDIIPALLNDGRKLFAYKFKGYWKDVGTIDSLWEANMDLLDKERTAWIWTTVHGRSIQRMCPRFRSIFLQRRA